MFLYSSIVLLCAYIFYVEKIYIYDVNCEVEVKLMRTSWKVSRVAFALLIVVFIAAIFMWPHGAGATTIRTTGATFPQYQIQKWITEYQKNHTDVKIEYEGGGSGHGQETFLQGLTQIGRSDPPVTLDVWNRFISTGDQPFQFPEIVGAVVVSYNLPGISHLNLSQDTLGGIFIGSIEYWDNYRIARDNPGIHLPHQKIIVVHRSDASGTTDIFTTYLSLINRTWAKEVGSGKTVNWPTDKIGRGLAGNGNPGVVAILKQTKYSICYTELSYAINEKLSTAALENRDGNFVEPTEKTIRAAVSKVSSDIPPPNEGYRENISQLLNAPGNESYPIVAFTHLLVWKNINGKHYTKEEAIAIKEFLKWILTDGQKPENLTPGYVGLPRNVAEIGLKAASQIEVP